MISLTKNSKTLQGYFGELAAVAANKAPGQKLVMDCHAECHATNEIAGLKYLPLEGRLSCLISPIFIDGCSDEAAFLNLAVGERYAQLLAAAHVQMGQLQFNAHKNWHNDHLVELDKISRLNDPEKMLSESLYIALSVLRKSDHKSFMAMVCGPISAPGARQDNLYRFNRTVMEVGKHMPVFNQLPFETVFERVHELLSTTHIGLLDSSDENSSEDIGEKRSKFFMERFYERVIKEGHPKWKPYFMKNWEKSVGAKTEHELFKLLGFDPVDIEATFGFLN